MTHALTEIARLGPPMAVHSLAYAGGTLIAGGRDGDVLIWRRDPAGWDPVEAPAGSGPRAVALTPDGAGVYVSEGPVVQTAPIRKHLRRLRPFFEAPAPVRALAWSPGGETLVVQAGDRVHALDWTGREQWSQVATGFSWHPGGQRVLLATDGLAWFERQTGVRQGPMGPVPAVFCVTFDGRIATADAGQVLAASPTGLAVGGDGLTVRGAEGTWAVQARVDHVVWTGPRELAVAGGGDSAITTFML